MFSQIWNLLTASPETFGGGAVWDVMCAIQGGLEATAYALLVLFFLIGVVRSTTDFRDLKRPESALRLFIRFAVAKIIVSASMELLGAIFSIVQGVLQITADSSGVMTGAEYTLPDIIVQKINECSFLESIPLWLVTLLGSLFIWVLSIVLVLTVYTRFFTLYMYTAVAPLPLASFAGEGTSRVGKQFLKSYAGVCLQGVIMLLACIIYSVFVTSPPQVTDDSLSAATMVWGYVGEVIFDMLILVVAVRTAEKTVREMIGY